VRFVLDSDGTDVLGTDAEVPYWDAE